MKYADEIFDTVSDINKKTRNSQYNIIKTKFTSKEVVRNEIWYYCKLCWNNVKYLMKEIITYPRKMLSSFRSFSLSCFRTFKFSL